MFSSSVGGGTWMTAIGFVLFHRRAALARGWHKLEPPALRGGPGAPLAGPLTPASRILQGTSPEEIVKHVNHFAGVDVHQQRVVVVAHPAVWSVDVGQAVLPRVVDPVVLAVEQLGQDRTDAEAPV